MSEAIIHRKKTIWLDGHLMIPSRSERTEREKKQDLYACRIAHLTAPWPSHKNFSVKFQHFVHADAAAADAANADTRGSAIALPVHSYRRCKTDSAHDLGDLLSKNTEATEG